MGPSHRKNIIPLVTVKKSLQKKRMIIIITIYKASGICCNKCCSKYEADFAQRCPYKKDGIHL